jgi:hypothetical protein
MIRSIRNLRLALLGAASSLALTALISVGRAAPFICDDTGPPTFNFTCGNNADTAGGSGRGR